jgi:hypothetical protein
MLTATSCAVQGQVRELQQTVVIPQIFAPPEIEPSWVPGAVVEVPPIFASGPFELKRPAVADPFTKYLERRLKRSYRNDWRWPAIQLDLARDSKESCAANSLASEYREAVEQFDDLRFQFFTDWEPEVYY